MAKKCGNCRYFVKVSYFRSYCDLKRRMRIKNDLVSVNSLACEDYVSSCEFNSDLSNNGTTSNCFLTSACVEYMGKPDDCYELTTLRNFRDNYLRVLAGGKELIAEYYSIAPKIVENINSSFDKEKYYSYIYTVVTQTIKLIENGKNTEAIKEYSAMVNHLKAEFFKGE